MKKILFFIINMIFLIATLINVFSLFYVYNQRNLDFVSNHFTSKDTVRLIANQKIDSEKWRELLEDQKNILVVKNLESNFYFKAIYTNYDWYLPLIEGRSFVREDFYDGKNRAIIGEGLANTDTGTIRIEEKEYEVIGILDSRYAKNLSKTALVNINSLEGNQTNGVYQINSNKATMEKLKSELINDIAAITYSEDTRSYNANNLENNNQVLRYSFQVLCLLAIGMCVLFYLTLTQSTRSLKKTIGISRNTVLLEEVKHLFFFWIIESILVLGGVYLPFKQSIYDSITIFAVSYISSQMLIVGCSVLLFSFLFIRNWRNIDEIK
ncbi:ABC transporter permease [Enterococcus sp. DIV1298c]|uniref:ABC transporter permease n=1 Tax=Enterococcus sp. DIV1298c TaxID=2815328 RepID=UPI001A922CDA|nr:ABC transporter permease [Enterococcus sp. DIV1298c]MBO0462484.1 ABC transporter permease [Enterococcus sp. DIV1298c]